MAAGSVELSDRVYDGGPVFFLAFVFFVVCLCLLVSGAELDFFNLQHAPPVTRATLLGPRSLGNGADGIVVTSGTDSSSKATGAIMSKKSKILSSQAVWSPGG